MSDLTAFVYRESMVCWANDPTGEDYPFDHDYHPAQDCDWGWVCNFDGCLTRVDEHPCPDHAPLIVAGLRRVECDADPVHVLFAVDRDDYGHGCPACWYANTSSQLHALKVATHRHRHGRWRRWRLSGGVLSLLKRVGIVRGHSWMVGDGCRGCIDTITWRWTKPPAGAR